MGMMSSYAFKGLLKFVGSMVACCVIMGTVLILFLLFGNFDKGQENAAYHAVIDYASNKTIGLPAGNPDKYMKGKPYESDSCPSGNRVWGLFWVRSHPCWIVEYPTAFNTYRWFVDLRDPQKVRRKALDGGKQVWFEQYEYRVKRLPPFDSYYPQSEDWNK